MSYAGHFGSHPGHGLEPGESVEVPREKILVAARAKSDPSKATGYDSQGKSVAQLKPASLTTKVHAVKPGTRSRAALQHGSHGLAGQGPRGSRDHDPRRREGAARADRVRRGEPARDFSIVLLTDDPKQGIVFVARWDLELQA